MKDAFLTYNLMEQCDKIFEGRKTKKSELQRLRRLLKNGVVKFSYKKKDGSVRKATGTLKKSLIPETDREDDRIKSTNKDVMNYWDLKKDDWRCMIKKNFIKIEEESENGKKD